MAVQTTYSCDVCKATCKDDESAASFTFSGPLPEKLQEFRTKFDQGQIPLDAGVAEDLVKEMRMARAAVKNYGLCGTCAEAVHGVVLGMRAIAGDMASMGGGVKH